MLCCLGNPVQNVLELFAQVVIGEATWTRCRSSRYSTIDEPLLIATHWYWRTWLIMTCQQGVDQRETMQWCLHSHCGNTGIDCGPSSLVE